MNTLVNAKKVIEKCRHSLEITTVDSLVCSLIEGNYMIRFAASGVDGGEDRRMSGSRKADRGVQERNDELLLRGSRGVTKKGQLVVGEVKGYLGDT